jgi:hypothetical protein
MVTSPDGTEDAAADLIQAGEAESAGAPLLS